MPSSIKAAFLTLVLAAGQRVLAVNDWSVPCIQGKCSWDLPADSGASGSVNIWGPVSAISDVTPAAGWQIMTKCNPADSKQDIQLMCKDNNPDCNHLFQGNGAVNTIVRLPNSCGPMPFARVAQHQVLQSNSVTQALGNLNGSEAPVHQLTLDTDFAAAGPSHGGDVNFSLQGQNLRDTPNIVNRRSHRRLRSHARSQNHIYRQTDGNSTASGNSTDSGSLSLPTFNRTLSANPDLVNFSGQKNLFTDGPSSIDINANVQLSVGISAVAAGKIVPPQVSQFGITYGLNGNADAKLSFSPGSTSGPISSANVTLFQSGLPGFSFPNILDITPKCTVLGRIDANFGIQNVDASVEVNYDFGGSSFTFPPQGGPNTDDIAPSSKQVSFSAKSDVGATLSASAHLIPEVTLDLNVLSGAVSGSVFLNVDASLGLQGSISASVSGGNPQQCLSGNADINVGVSGQGSLFGLFDLTKGKTFDNNFPLFTQCFGGDNSTSSTTQSSSTATDSASQTQTSATDATTTDPASQTGAPGGAPVVPPIVPPIVPPVVPPGVPGGEPGATATDPASQTGASATATDSASQISTTATTATDSAFPTILPNAPTTDSASQTIVANTTTTDSASQTVATDATTTNSASQIIVANGTTTDSASQTIVANATATDSASQISVTDATTINSVSQTVVANATATDLASQTSATDVTTTDSVSQTGGSDATTTDSASQASTTDATATDSASQISVTDSASTPERKRHVDAPRVRYSA